MEQRIRNISSCVLKSIMQRLAQEEEPTRPRTGDSMWNAQLLRDELKYFQFMRSATQIDASKSGGNHFGIVRDYIQRKCVNGESVTWGSRDVLNFRNPITVSDLEQLACSIAAGSLS